ncbi:hypothetical protein H4582DRAFT_2053981 [Lactarius indigo]|nr:hypothetical protein H4582DRAFT_2053981 [Lactarius indigo]
MCDELFICADNITYLLQEYSLHLDMLSHGSQQVHTKNKQRSDMFLLAVPQGSVIRTARSTIASTPNKILMCANMSTSKYCNITCIIPNRGSDGRDEPSAPYGQAYRIGHNGTKTRRPRTGNHLSMISASWTATIRCHKNPPAYLSDLSATGAGQNHANNRGCFRLVGLVGVATVQVVRGLLGGMHERAWLSHVVGQEWPGGARGGTLGTVVWMSGPEWAEVGRMRGERLPVAPPTPLSSPWHMDLQPQSPALFFRTVWGPKPSVAVDLQPKGATGWCGIVGNGIGDRTGVVVGRGGRGMQQLVAEPKNVVQRDRAQIGICELVQNKRHQKQKAADTPALAKSSKCLAQDWPLQAPKDKSADPLPEIKFECDRCVDKGYVCKIWPTQPSDLCQVDKARCSLVPHDQETGKPICNKLSEQDVLVFCLEMYKKKLELASEEVKEPAPSASRLSPSSTLKQPLHGMTLESGGSSHADSPTTNPASANSPLAAELCVKVTAPKFPQLLAALPCRVAALEVKMDKLEKWMKEVDYQLEEGGL